MPASLDGSISTDETGPEQPEERSGLEWLWMVRYSEIALKSEPVRRQWEKVLVTNILQVLPGVRAERERGRIWLSGRVDPKKLKKVPGITSFSPCLSCTLSELHGTVLRAGAHARLDAAASFAVRVRRTGTHPFTSQELAADLGDCISRQYPQIHVDLMHPEKEISVEIRGDRCYVYTQRIRGPGGIPLGVEGTLVVLMSGGIDSPVAAWMMMKRGCRIVPLYIGLTGFLDETALGRVERVIERLQEYQPDIELAVIQDDYLQAARAELVREGLERYICLICKRRMYRLAEERARAIGAKGIVTGESLGQVASQTLDNLEVLSDAATIPLYRPLIGFDKEDIVRIAREIGTYEPSTIRTTGCRAVPAKPATRADVDRIRRIERRIQESIGGAAPI
ncbi:MAG: tRNA uracil 4-sulfurtransferase ThiI [Methanomicrobiales archaeon]|nr:tRNA uracil 4-sulfurtransferase ThiI [Methanomicrobiales archaeon]MDI6875632.1 tRNA uracil 4-sulfurtransferase ThiI [Methanomicrobiales archaeon]